MNKYFWAVSILVLTALGYFLSTNQSKNTATQTIKQENRPSTQVNSTECNKTPTPQLTEGPYYKFGAPLRTDLREEGTIGEPITITGFVYDTNCQKIAGAWIDFWQADGEGVYDNAGYKLRGHQFTDSLGKYTLNTVIPGKYPGRTPHIHVKLRATQNSPKISSQLFMPGESQNQTDPIFNKELIMEVKQTEEGKSATFDFVLTK